MYSPPRPVLNTGKPVGFQQIAGLGAGAAGVKRGMFQQPDQFGLGAGQDGFDPSLHGGDRRFVRLWVLTDAPGDLGARIQICQRLCGACDHSAILVFPPSRKRKDKGRSNSLAVVAELVDAQR